MPLARIITRHTEEAAALASRLQSQGYEVEVWSPEETRTGACDVELVLDKAPVAEAMETATEFARANDADVFVGSGVLVSETQWRQQQEAARREQERLAAEAEARKRAEEERHRQAEIAAARAAQEVAERRKREEVELREREQRNAAEAEARRRAEEEAMARIAAEVEQRRRAEQEAARIAAETAVRERRIAAEAEARRRAEEEAREAVLNARIAEATGRAEQVASTTDAHERREHMNAAPSVEHLTAPYIPSRKLPVRPSVPRRALRGRERDLRVAAVASIGVAILLAFLWTVLSNQRPADPLGPQEIMRSNGIEQAAPFGAARTRPVSTTPTAQPQTPSAQPAPQEAATATPQQKAKPSPSRRAARSDDEVEVMPEDVVIRHYNRPATTAAPSQQRAGVKVISDLEVD